MKCFMVKFVVIMVVSLIFIKDLVRKLIKLLGSMVWQIIRMEDIMVKQLVSNCA